LVLKFIHLFTYIVLDVRICPLFEVYKRLPHVGIREGARINDRGSHGRYIYYIINKACTVSSFLRIRLYNTQNTGRVYRTTSGLQGPSGARVWKLIYKLKCIASEYILKHFATPHCHVSYYACPAIYYLQHTQCRNQNILRISKLLLWRAKHNIGTNGAWHPQYSLTTSRTMYFSFVSVYNMVIYLYNIIK